MTNFKIEYNKIEDESNGYIIPIGGGKDSVVTLETLKSIDKDIFKKVISQNPENLFHGFTHEDYYSFYNADPKRRGTLS